MPRRILWIFALLAALLPAGAQAAFDSAAQPGSGPLTVERVTPDGEDVPPSRQIAIEFNRPVVPIGKMDRSSDEIPISITPSLACQWRWITTQTLACILDEKNAMKPATEYKLHIQPGLKTQDGTTLAAAEDHSFITRRPQIRDVNFRVWKSPTEPVLRVVWDQPVTKQSVAQHLYMFGADKKRAMVDVSSAHEKRFLPHWLHMPGEKEFVANDEDEEAADDQPVQINGQEARRIWLVQPLHPLPAGQTVALHAEPGFISAQGPMASVQDEDVKEFDTFSDFAFVSLRCTTDDNNEIHFKPEDKKSAGRCDPLEPIALEFNAPVSRQTASLNVSFSPGLTGNKPGVNPWGDMDEEDVNVTSSHTADQLYSVYLPIGLKAAQPYDITIAGENFSLWERIKRFVLAWMGKPLPEGNAIHDKFGRPLKKPVTVAFATDHRSPNMLLEYQAAILEKNIESDVPVYVDNIKQINWSYNFLTMDGSKDNTTYTADIAPVQDVQFQVPVGVRAMLGGESGALWGNAETVPTLDDKYRNRKLFAEVTPYQIHAKLGHFNSMVWVTDLATGEPVADADVVIYKDRIAKLAGPAAGAATAHTDANGVALLPGTEQLDPSLSIKSWGGENDIRFFIRVSKGKDMALLPIWYMFEVDNYRSAGTSFYPQNKTKSGHMVIWGTSAEGIYHPGDTVQYKLFVRNQNNEELIPAPKKGYWLEVVDPTGKVVHTVKDITLSDFGGFDGEFTTGKKAAVGWYSFRLKANLSGKKPSAPEGVSCGNDSNQDDDKQDSDTDDDNDDNGNSCGSPAEFTWTPLRVLVSDFTPVPFEVRNQLSGDLFHPGDSIGIDTDAKLHSGGPYTQAQTRVTAILTPSPFTSKNPVAAGFKFGAELESTEPQQLYQTSGPLDDKGENKASFAIDDRKIYHGRLMVESAVQDDRGKYIAHQSYADYVGVDRFVGLRMPKWFYSVNDDIAPDYIVVDERGVPVKDAPVSMVLERKERAGAKVKSQGDSYVPETETTIVKESECHGTSGDAVQTCHLTPAHAGEYTLRATVTDSKGRTQETAIPLWISGHDYVMWDDGSDTTLDIVPDKENYHIGDTAHFLVKNPYPGAKALVTVERYGVIDRFVTTLQDSAAVIDLPIKPNYMPGFYLSVNVMSPRVEKPLPEAGQVDLGKPTFRMGYVRVPVKDPYKEIDITAKTDQEVYRPGDKVKVHIDAKARYPKGEPVELAVVVVDEAVFDLIAGGKDYYDPYNGFYNLDGLDLRNYSLLTRLIGRQKFEKKGANPGGDGGSSLNMRSVFKYISYWNPALKPDAAGHADIEFTVPDNLTGWHIFVLADTPSDRFGLGEGNFKVNRPTEVRPEMPNQVSEGDQFEARFSVMNRTKQDRTLKVAIHAEGDIDPSLPGDMEKSVTLKPYERSLVALPVKAGKVDEKRDAEEGQIRFTASAGDDIDADGMKHSLPVHKLRSLEVGANYGTTTADKAEEPIAFPDNIYPDVGSLTVTAAPSVIGNLEGAFKYLRDYPYPCWEQVLTRGVMADHYKNLKPYLSDKLAWPDAVSLPDHTLGMAAEYQAPNGGMAYFIATDDHADPYLSAYTALAFNWLRHDGYSVPENVEKKLHGYLLDMLRHDQMPSFYSQGMASTVRAVALAALADSHEIDRSDIERYAPFVKEMSLFGKAHFAMAALAVPDSQKEAVDAAKMILAHANETGGKFVFSEELDDGYARILSSPMRENCAVLDLFTALGETPYGKSIGDDVPYKLVRTITQTRAGRDHWENTQENMFCMNALVDFSRVYEKDKPAMTVTASLDDKQFGTAPFNDFRDPQATFEHPIDKADIGRQAKMTLTRTGTGRVYYATRLAYAPRESKADGTNAGIEIHREYSMQHEGKWELLAKPYAVHQGDVVRVDLYVSLPAPRNFVVVDDPVPGGFEPVNSELANNSKVDAAKGAFMAAGGSMWFKYNDWNDYNFSFWSFNHQELLHNAARFYADYLPAGNYHLSYTAQAIGAGQFAIMPALAQEMYDPDIYGKTGFDQLSVTSNMPASP